MPNCDWGDPCDCIDCLSNKKGNKCDIYNCDKIPIHSRTNYNTDRKSMSYYTISEYCEIHYNELKKNEANELIKRNEELIKRTTESKKIFNKFIESSINLEEKLIPIKYIDTIKISILNNYKYDLSRAHFNNDYLSIKKVGRYWKICENRIKLFYILGMNRYYSFTDPRK